MYFHIHILKYSLNIAVIVLLMSEIIDKRDYILLTECELSKNKYARNYVILKMEECNEL